MDRTPQAQEKPSGAIGSAVRARGASVQREGLAGLRATINLAPIGIAHFALDGLFLLVNEHLCTILGYERQELLTRTFQDITYVDDLPECLELNARLAAGEIPSYSQEKRFVRGDGSLIWTRVTVAAIRKRRSREVAFMIGIAEDVSEHRAQAQARKLAEVQLRESEARFRSIANGMPQLAWISDGDGTRSWYNDRWLEYTGLSFERLRGHGWHEVPHPEFLPRVRDGQLACFREGEIWEDTVPLRGKDGAYRWFLSRAVPVRDVNGNIVQWFGTNTDITELEAARDRERETRRELERAKQWRDDVIAIVSHDLRNPLQTISLGAALLSSPYLPADQHKRQLEILRRTTKHMEALISDLLDVSRIDAGRLVVEHATVDVRRLLEEACEQFETVAAERQRSLMCEVSPELPAVSGDRARLMQLLSNLVGNAFKFTAPNGRVILRAVSVADWVELSVSDNGIGIAPEKLPHLFDRFWQADRASGRGVGLGLTISKGIVEAHGGRIWAESTPGSGTTVSFTLPAVP